MHFIEKIIAALVSSLTLYVPSTVEGKLDVQADIRSQSWATFLLALDRRHCSLARPENCDSQIHRCSRY